MDEKKFAVLIDADNISNKYAELIFKEASNFGNVMIKRIYGDWSKPDLASWRNTLLDYSILPVQQFNYTTGKNSTDSAIIIDAMDILFSQAVDGFCIITSDSDFTRLVARLRESDMYVVGMGERKTPAPLVRACSEFKYLDVILKNSTSVDVPKKQKPRPSAPKKAPIEAPSAAVPDQKPERLEQPAKQEEVKHEFKEEAKAEQDAAKIEHSDADNENRTEVAELFNIIKEIFEVNAERGDWLEISFLDAQIKKRKPDFDFRVFGYKKMVQFFESLDTQGLRVKKVPDASNHKNPSHRVFVGFAEE